MNEQGLDAALAQMWAGFADLARSRVGDVEAYAAALSAGRADAALRTAARASAHKLAGALGSFGRPGSDEAGALEVLLADGSPEPDPARVQALARSLRAAVEA